MRCLLRPGAPAGRIEAGLARARQLGWVPGGRLGGSSAGHYLAGDDGERVMSLRQALDAGAVAWAMRGSMGSPASTSTACR